ncbi:MAG: TlpA family protein disulfide reductase [Chitinophagaceae bacterium]|nr:TlpA family protein disulfide reductase [Chitinophagaceae bacterium]
MKRGLIILLLAGSFSLSYGQKIAKWKITDVEKLMSAGDSLLVINFWATFCKPCIHEIPDFIRISKQYAARKVKLILVSLDLPDYYPGKIAAFVKKNGYDTQLAWLNETNADYFCPKISEKWSGAIPATILVNPRTGFRLFYEDELTAEQFEDAVKKLVDSDKRKP